MAVKRNGLGKGLDSLIPNKTSKLAEPAEKKNIKPEKEDKKIILKRSFCILNGYY